MWAAWTNCNQEKLNYECDFMFYFYIIVGWPLTDLACDKIFNELMI